MIKILPSGKTKQQLLTCGTTRGWPRLRQAEGAQHLPRRSAPAPSGPPCQSRSPSSPSRLNERVRLGWVGLGWVGLGWVGLGWVGLGWVGLGRVGSGRVAPGRVEVDWVSWVRWFVNRLRSTRVSGVRVGYNRPHDQCLEELIPPPLPPPRPSPPPPPTPTFVDHGQYAQHLDLPDVSRGNDAETNLAHVERVIVSLVTGVGVDVVWVLPSSREAPVVEKNVALQANKNAWKGWGGRAGQ